MKTRVTELLGIRDPIIQAACSGSARPSAALALGAQGINMGTRFMCTREAPIHDDIKRALVNGSERDTNLIFRTMHNTARAAAGDRHARPSSPAHGRVNEGIVSAGMVIGLIDDTPSCAELIERIVRECREHLQLALARVM